MSETGGNMIGAEKRRRAAETGGDEDPDLEKERRLT